MNPAPVLRIKGTVHSASARTVQAVEAAPVERDESGRITREAREARDAYDVLDVTVLTEQGGYALVLMHGDHVEQHLDGVVPNKGDAVDWPVRPYSTWAGRPGRRYPVVGLSVAGDALAEDRAALKSAGGRRSVEAVANAG